MHYEGLKDLLTYTLAPMMIGFIFGRLSSIRKKCKHDFVLISKDITDKTREGGIENIRYNITMNCKKCGQTRIVDTKRGDINVYE